jgi:cytochrome P450
VAQAPPALPPRFDPDTPENRSDPYPAYARLRASGPLCRGGLGQWAVTRYADVSALLADTRLGNAFPPEYHQFSAGAGPAADFLSRIVLHQDSPRHTWLRRRLARGFTPALVRRLSARITSLVDDLLDGPARRGQLEVVSELAFPLPIMVVCELTGIPADRREQVRPRAFDLGRAFAASVGEDSRAAADQAVTWMRGYLGELLDQRRRQPGDDLLSQLALAVEAGGPDGADPLTREEIVDNAVFLFFAGFETTTSMIATGCAALLDHPGERARLWARPSLARSAVEEFLRYDAPIQSRLRLVREPLTVCGRTIRPGRALLLLVGSANRDERQFARPGTLDITRDPNPHLAFGGGAHYCLGAYLARIEGEIVFSQLVRRFAEIQPAGPARREPRSAFRTYASIPVTVTPRPPGGRGTAGGTA